VPGGTTLNIKPGTKIYMHSNAYLEVFGKLTALGNKNDSIVFQGDRLEHYYDELPGQWGGLIFIRNCQPCSLVHVIIKNAGTGIIAGSDTTSNVSAYNISTAPKIYLEKCVIKNCDENAVFGFLSDITAINSLFYNCSKQVVQLLFGGIYNFKHCTIANYENTNIEHQTPCLRISNWAGFNNAAVLTDVDVKFTNSIIYGSIDKNKEIIIDKDYGVPTGTTFNYLFQHCLLKTDIATSSFPSNFLSCMINQNPMFASTNLNANFTLITGSPAIDNGLKTLGVIDDINDASRDANPDMGCYEK
jgi:hypothetical protein